MYSCDSLIGQAYGKLEYLEGYGVLKIVPKAEQDFYRFIEELENDEYIENAIVYKIVDRYSTLLSLSEVKGFISGIYFALKLRDEFKEEFQKMDEFINSFNN